MAGNRRLRTRKRHPAVELNITAFMNLMVVLVPFLLMTAVFTHMSILELNLPGMDQAKNTPNKPSFELRVTIRKNALILSDNKGGLIKRIPNTPRGPNYAQLTETLKLIKARFPDKTNAHHPVRTGHALRHAGTGDGCGAHVSGGGGHRGDRRGTVPGHRHWRRAAPPLDGNRTRR